MRGMRTTKNENQPPGGFVHDETQAVSLREVISQEEERWQKHPLLLDNLPLISIC
jgi:hypothetical protein